jgi:beta-lactamase superfamily II metal-dependent hydrolase
MELNIYFKNVGQGDTIFLDWVSGENATRKFALIDCNMIGNNIDPVIRHIKDHEIREFEFVLLTHPHSDHFSGLLPLFDYCEENSIVINRFLHTSNYSMPVLRTMLERDIGDEDFKAFVLSGVHYEPHKEKLLQTICRVMVEVEKNGRGFIKDVDTVNSIPFLLSENIRAQFLAPSSFEFREYARANYVFEAGSKPMIRQDNENNPEANMLSTFIRIFNDVDQWQVLLSSDCTRETFERILENPNLHGVVTTSKLLAMQVPHHGSRKNHTRAFWDGMQHRKETHAIVSVGLGYGHPARSVIEYFKDNYHCVHATNFVGGYREVFGGKPGGYHPLAGISMLDLPAVNAGATGYGGDMDNSGPICSEKHLRVTVKKGEASCVLIPSEHEAPDQWLQVLRGTP